MMVDLPFITADEHGPKHLVSIFTRALLEKLTKELMDRTERPCLQALEDASLSPQQIDVVILVGGSTRMPAVREKARE